MLESVPPRTRVVAMEQLEGSDLWVLVVRIRDLDRAAFSYRFLPADGHEPREWAERSATWRGPEAPPAPAVAQTLVGELRTVELDSAALGEHRRLHVYLPPPTIVATRMESCTPPTGG